MAKRNMQHLLEKKFFPHVIKPGRYTGGEPGQIIKPPENRLKMAIGYPDLYEIGMSYLGMQILYHIINADDRFICERFFAPDIDAEKILRRENIPIFSLESYRPLKEFDIVGFTLAYEMVYTNMLNILDLAGIPLKSDERGQDDPLIIAGGPVVHNPEPTAPFIDLYYLGDAEENIIKLLEVIRDSKNLPREKKLERIAEDVPSVYVPKLYDASTHIPLVFLAPSKIKSCRIPELKREYYPADPIVPFIETVHDRLVIEIMRGCPNACRFCQATSIYRPVRLRSIDEIASQAHETLDKTGYDEVSLLSLSSGDYPDIIPLTMRLARELYQKRVALAFPSLRPGGFTQELAEAVKTTRKTGLTFAPEAGTERLRTFMQKNISDRELYDTIHIAFRNDWKLIKLYFMLGLPSETDEDIEGIINMIRNVCRIAGEYKGKRVINITLSPFSPKAHTALQWDTQPSPDYIRRKADYIMAGVKNRFVNFKLHNPKLAFLEGVIGRGGRELADVIKTAWADGARLDGWSEHFNYDLWITAFEKNGLDPNNYLRARSYSDTLPWSHIVLPVSEKHLMRQRTSSAMTLKEPKKDTVSTVQPQRPAERTNSFGRSPRRSAKAVTVIAPTKGHIRIRWGRRGMRRFLSHLDNIRVIERVLRRSGLPVAWSQGFHPHMKMSFGPPLTLGFTSEAEYFDLTLERPIQADLMEKPGRILPGGFYFIAAQIIKNPKASISSIINRAVYELVLEEDNDIEDKIEALLIRDKIEVGRVKKDTVRTIDIRPAIYSLGINRHNADYPGQSVLTLELGIGQAGYARPGEVVVAAGLIDKENLPALIFHRKALLGIDDNNNRLTPMDF